MNKPIFTTAAAAITLAAFSATPAQARFLQTDPIGYEDNNNLYAYVGNDPVNGVDPTGEKCVNNTTAGTTRCVTANYDVTVPTAKGFQNTGRNVDYYHTYHVSKASPQDAKNTREWVKNNPTPGRPFPATSRGTKNNATPTAFSGLRESPVVSYTAINKITGNTVVVNMTLSGHPLGNGVVIREVSESTYGRSTIHNYGEGNGFLQSSYSPIANSINNVWAGDDMAPPREVYANLEVYCKRANRNPC